VKEENVDLIADSCNILNRWKNYFSRLLNAHEASNVRQTEVHTTELIVPDSSPFEAEISVAKLKRYRSQGSDKILAELFQAGIETLCSESHKVINSIWNKEELPDQWKECSIILQIHKKSDKTGGSKYHGLSLMSRSYNILFNISFSR
jgi:hypothetical protein